MKKETFVTIIESLKSIISVEESMSEIFDFQKFPITEAVFNITDAISSELGVDYAVSDYFSGGAMDPGKFYDEVLKDKL